MCRARADLTGRRTALALLLLVVALAGCGGGGGGGGGGSAAPLTKSAFIARGDAICRDFSSAIQKAEDEQRSKPAGTQVAGLYDRLIDLAQATLQRFRALTPPAADRATIERYLAGQQQALGLVRQIAAATKAGNDTKVGSLLGRSDALRKSQAALAGSVGFKDCGTGAA